MTDLVRRLFVFGPIFIFRRPSVVTDVVQYGLLSICLSVTFIPAGKVARWNDMPFGRSTVCTFSLIAVLLTQVHFC